jgi:hypothetical protein
MAYSNLVEVFWVKCFKEIMIREDSEEKSCTSVVSLRLLKKTLVLTLATQLSWNNALSKESKNQPKLFFNRFSLLEVVPIINIS